MLKFLVAPFPKQSRQRGKPPVQECVLTSRKSINSVWELSGIIRTGPRRARVRPSLGPSGKSTLFTSDLAEARAVHHLLSTRFQLAYCPT
jgi:hypothetical protein